MAHLVNLHKALPQAIILKIIHVCLLYYGPIFTFSNQPSGIADVYSLYSFSMLLG